jgi:peptidoglycan/LPS O-acetylase OafA/YrhL
VGYWNGWDATEGHNVIFGFTTLAVSFTGLLIFLITGESSFLGRVFSFSPVRYIGKISYGIYLLHAGLFSFLARLDHNRFMGAIEQRWIVAIPLRVALTVFVAALSFKFFESPILRLKNRVR